MIANSPDPTNRRAGEAPEWVLGAEQGEGAKPACSLARPQEGSSSLTRSSTVLLAPNGAEVFTPALTADDIVILEIGGVYRFYSGLFRTTSVDARYVFPLGGAPKKHPWLHFDPHQVLTLLTEDRQNHCYSFLVKGCRGKVAVRMAPPHRATERWAGFLMETRPLSAAERAATGLPPLLSPGAVSRATEAALAERYAQEQAPARQHHAQEEHCRVALEQRRVAWINSQIREYEDSSHYTDEKYLRNVAAAMPEALIAKRAEFNREWEEFHSDAEAVRRLKATSPITYERARYKRRTVAYAEELWAVKAAAVLKTKPHRKAEPARLPPPKPPAPKKETPQEWLERQLRHRSNKATGVIALARQKKIAREELRELDLESDEYDRRAAVLDEIYTDPDPEREAYNATKL